MPKAQGYVIGLEVHFVKATKEVVPATGQLLGRSVSAAIGPALMILLRQIMLSMNLK